MNYCIDFSQISVNARGHQIVHRKRSLLSTMAYSLHGVAYCERMLVMSCVVQLTDWRSKDERLIQAVKKGSLQTVRRLVGAKLPANPAKFDPNRACTACVSLYAYYLPLSPSDVWVVSPVASSRLCVSVCGSKCPRSKRKNGLSCQHQ